jgi:predicted lipoprotein with Yx(FWY)xxD motif
MNRNVAILSVALSALSVGAVADIVQPAGIGTQKTVFGEVLADVRSMTLYVSDQDGTGKSACTGACLENWTPLAAPRIARPVGAWTIAARDDGSRQWVYQGKPVYGFAGDHAPGDVNGEGAGWHAAFADRAYVPPGITVHKTDYGPTFVTTDGRTLYMEISFFYNAGADATPRHQSSPAPSACSGDCARTWMPLTASKDAKPAGDWSIVARDDGVQQWAWKGHPLFTYTQDAKPGDTLGEGHWTLIGNVGTHWEVANIVL